MSDDVAKLTAEQIEVLQRQFKDYKALKKIYGESSLAKAESLIRAQNPNVDDSDQKKSVKVEVSIGDKPGEEVSEAAAAAVAAADNTNTVSSSTAHQNRLLRGDDADGEYTATFTPVGSATSASTSNSEFKRSDSIKRVDSTTSVEAGGSDEHQQAPPPPPVKAALTWQCVNSLLTVGPTKPVSETAISLASSDVGCFLKSAKLPLVPTRPFVASLREKLIRYGAAAEMALPLSNSSGTVADDIKEGTVGVNPKNDRHGSNNSNISTAYWKLQRKLRSEAVQQYVFASGLDVQVTEDDSLAAVAVGAHPPVSHGCASYAAELLPFHSHQRVRRQVKREARNWERDERRAAFDLEDRRKKKTLEYLKSVMFHRDDFVRYHKNKKAEVSRMARAVKAHVESVDQKREKEERRTEERRLQALKENDMEAYASLLHDTKNDRLKHLLNETDSYMQTINKMIQDQRTDALAEEGEGGGTSDAVTKIAASNTTTDVGQDGEGSSSSKSTAANYYDSTHVNRERVVQPAMLKGGELKEYQLQGLQWLVSLYNNNLNGILADEMGLGKTIQAISLLTYLMEFKQNNGPFLVVVPLSTLSNWVNEFNRWAPDIIKVVYKGLPDERKRIYKEEIETGVFNVLLTTYEFIMRDKSALKKLKFQYIIVDEGHRMKNADSKFAQTLGTAYQSKYRILLTGTPLQNNLPELWALLNFLLPSIFSSMDTFDQWFNKPFAAFRATGSAVAVAGAGGDGSGEGAAPTDLNSEERLLIVHRLHEVLRPFMLRRVKSQVLDQLPDKVEKVLRCSLSGWQRKMYHSVTVKGLANKIANDDGTPVVAGGGLNNTIMQLRKVCNHPYLFLRNYIVDEDLVRISGKFELLDRMLPKLKAAGHRVLMFSQMVELMNVMEHFLIMRGFKFLRLDGNTTSDDREKRMFMFNDPDSPYFIFLLSTRAGGLGLNLASADTVVIFDSDWNPMMDAQAQDRAHRIGQRNEVKVFRLITTSGIEERILARANDKLNLTGLVVEAGKFGAQGNKAAAHSQENKALMESLLNEYSSGGVVEPLTGGGIDGDDQRAPGEVDYDAQVEADEDVPDDHQINEMMASYPGEMEIYQRWDHDRFVKRESSLKEMQSYHAASSSSSSSSSATAAAAAIPLGHNPLMSAAEMPKWLSTECWPPRYSVLMTDMMAADVPPVASSAAGGARYGSEKKKGKPGRKRKVVELLEDGGDVAYTGAGGYGNEEEEDEETAEPVMKAGKAMRARKSVVYDDGMTEKQFSRFVEKQEDIATKSAALSRQQLKAKQQSNAALRKQETNIEGTIYHDLLRVVKCIQHCKRSEEGSFLAELFWEKPSKQLYPHYYQFIEHPISMKEIIAKLRKREYQFFEEIELDWALLVANARMFNMDTSPIYRDAERIRSLFYTLAAPVRAKFGLVAPKLTAPALPLAGHVIVPRAAYKEAIDTSLTAVSASASAAVIAAEEEEQTIEFDDEGSVLVSYADVVDSDDRPPHIKRTKPVASVEAKTPGKRGRPARVQTEPKLSQSQDLIASAGAASGRGITRVNSSSALSQQGSGVTTAAAPVFKLNIGNMAKQAAASAQTSATTTSSSDLLPSASAAPAAPRLVLSLKRKL